MNSMARFTEHKPGRLNAHECSSGKHVYEAEKYARRSLRWMREHGEIRQGHPYRCPHCPGWHITSTPKIKKARPGR